MGTLILVYCVSRHGSGTQDNHTGKSSKKLCVGLLSSQACSELVSRILYLSVPLQGMEKLQVNNGIRSNFYPSIDPCFKAQCVLLLLLSQPNWDWYEIGNLGSLLSNLLLQGEP